MRHLLGGEKKEKRENSKFQYRLKFNNIPYY